MSTAIRAAQRATMRLSASPAGLLLSRPWRARGLGARLLGARARRALAAERGDVPGWVLVTLMTAGLVVALWAVAGPALVNIFTSAMNKVTGAI